MRISGQASASADPCTHRNFGTRLNARSDRRMSPCRATMVAPVAGSLPWRSLRCWHANHAAASPRATYRRPARRGDSRAVMRLDPEGRSVLLQVVDDRVPRRVPGPVGGHCQVRQGRTRLRGVQMEPVVVMAPGISDDDRGFQDLARSTCFGKRCGSGESRGRTTDDRCFGIDPYVASPSRAMSSVEPTMSVNKIVTSTCSFAVPLP